MARIDWRNNTLRLLSLLLAFALWIYVSNEQNPFRDKVISINLEHTGTTQDILITGGMPDSVRVKVQGNRSQLTNLAPGDFRAVVNIPEGKTGEMVLPVQVSAPAGLRVAQVIPEEVNLTIDRLVEKQIPVAVSLRGSPAEGSTALAPECRPGTVVARGPSHVISEINQATAVLDIQSASKDVEQTIQISVGHSNVSLSPTAVNVVVPIVSTVLTKNVPVLPQVIGRPAAGFIVKRSVAEPAAVQLTGPADVLDALANIKTETVDVNGADKSFTKEVAISAPQGVSAQPGRVTVRVEVGKTDTPPQQAPGDGSAEQPGPKP